MIEPHVEHGGASSWFWIVDSGVFAAVVTVAGASQYSTIQNQEDAPPCSTCGSIMIRSGACYQCVNCGNTSGCA